MRDFWFVIARIKLSKIAILRGKQGYKIRAAKGSGTNCRRFDNEWFISHREHC